MLRSPLPGRAATIDLHKPPELFNMTAVHDSWFKKFRHKCQNRIVWLVDLIRIFTGPVFGNGGLVGEESRHDFAVSGTSVVGSRPLLGLRAKMIICRALWSYMHLRIYTHEVFGPVIVVIIFWILLCEFWVKSNLRTLSLMDRMSPKCWTSTLELLNAIALAEPFYVLPKTKTRYFPFCPRLVAHIG